MPNLFALPGNFKTPAIRKGRSPTAYSLAPEFVLSMKALLKFYWRESKQIILPNGFHHKRPFSFSSATAMQSPSLHMNNLKGHRSRLWPQGPDLVALRECPSCNVVQERQEFACRRLEPERPLLNYGIPNAQKGSFCPKGRGFHSLSFDLDQKDSCNNLQFICKNVTHYCQKVSERRQIGGLRPHGRTGYTSLISSKEKA